MLITAIILLISCAFFTLAEIAFTSCDVIKLRGLSPRKREADFTYRFLKKPERFLSTVLVGTNLSMVALSVLASNIFSFQPWMEGLSPLILTFCVLIFAEIIPKGIAYRFALSISLVLSKPFNFLYWMFFPIISLVTMTARGVLRVFKISVNGETSLLKEEEVRATMAGLPLQERKLVLRMLDFSDKRVEEVMIPRNRIVAVSSDISLPEFVDSVIKSGHSRIPVYEGDLDNIVGFVRVKEVITNYISREAKKNRKRKIGGGKQKTDSRLLFKVLHKCMFVPPYKRIEELMGEMKKEYRYIAIVKDEYGGTAGLITLEDILEELLGEIRDEYDFLEPCIEKAGETFLMDGETDLDELRYEIGVDIQERGTVSSLLLSRLKTMPKAGEKIVFNWGTIEIVSVHRRKIDRVKIMKKKN
jgi:CBS domain containing-hemolysin-like protein